MKVMNDQERQKNRAGEQGWAMLGVLLALSVIAIAMLKVVPRVQTQVRREKEVELMYRGDQMARAVARYYSVRGQLAPINPFVFPRGPLVDLQTLRNGIVVGTTEIKVLRLSAMIEPLSNGDWEPVRIYDPRIGAALQAYAAANNVLIPPSLLQLAGQQIRLDSPGFGDPPAGRPPVTTNPDDPNDPSDPNDPNDDIDDPAPGERFGPDTSRWPIVGVAPKLKGKSIKSLWGLNDYSEWVFIYIPNNLQPQVPPSQGGDPPPTDRVPR